MLCCSFYLTIISIYSSSCTLLDFLFSLLYFRIILCQVFDLLTWSNCTLRTIVLAMMAKRKFNGPSNKIHPPPFLPKTTFFTPGNPLLYQRHFIPLAGPVSSALQFQDDWTEQRWRGAKVHSIARYLVWKTLKTSGYQLTIV